VNAIVGWTPALSARLEGADQGDRAALNTVVRQ